MTILYVIICDYIITRNIARIDRLNRGGGLRFYYQSISFVSIKMEPLNLPDFKMEVIQELKCCNYDMRQT